MARWVLPASGEMATDCNIFGRCCRVKCGEVRVISTAHPLSGRLVAARSFNGVLLLAIELPDGSPGTIPVAAADVLRPVARRWYWMRRGGGPAGTGGGAGGRGEAAGRGARARG